MQANKAAPHPPDSKPVSKTKKQNWLFQLPFTPAGVKGRGGSGGQKKRGQKKRRKSNPQSNTQNIQTSNRQMWPALVLPISPRAIHPDTLHPRIQRRQHVQLRIVAHMQHFLVPTSQRVGRRIKNGFVRLGQTYGMRAHAACKKMPNPHQMDIGIAIGQSQKRKTRCQARQRPGAIGIQIHLLAGRIKHPEGLWRQGLRLATALQGQFAGRSYRGRWPVAR